MLKRARWAGAGAALGAAAAVWVQRKWRVAAHRYRPSGLAADAVEKAISVPGTLRDAFSEGRDAMREREAELRRNHLRAPRRSTHP